jgi:L-lysine exporter family protein LysE/ArgO
MVTAFTSGLKLSLGLIAAIGAQNAFVLRQGLRREHVLAVVLFCALSDAVLITLGVTGLSALTDVMPWVAPVLLWGGAAFLLAYGARSIWAAWQGGAALRVASDVAPARLVPVLGTMAALTWLNPHVYLDTVVLIGAVAVQFPGQQAAFGSGAVAGSFLFFFMLGFGARALAPVFARPRAWQVLDLLVGLTMWSIAVSLILR